MTPEPGMADYVARKKQALADLAPQLEPWEHWGQCVAWDCPHRVHKMTLGEHVKGLQGLLSQTQPSFYLDKSMEAVGIDLSADFAAIVRPALRALLELMQGVSHQAAKTRERDAKLEGELAQLRGGHLFRTHDEILGAIDDALALALGTGATQSRRQTAARVAEALRWVLEPPETPTRTSFSRSSIV